MLSIPKGQKEKRKFFNGLVSYPIGIVLSVSVLYRIIIKIKGTHSYISVPGGLYQRKIVVDWQYRLYQFSTSAILTPTEF